MPTSTEIKLQKVKDLFGMLNDSLTREEFVEAFKAITSLILKIETKWNEENLKRIAALEKLQETLAGKLGSANVSEFSALKDEITVTASKLFKEQKDGLDFIRDKVRKIKEGKDGYTPVKGKDYFDGVPGKPGQDGSPDTPEIIVQKIKSVPVQDGLDIVDIYKLREELDTLKRLTKAGGTRIMAVARGSVKLHDLSDSLDGVTKTFSLPAFWYIISVQASSVPNVLRPTVDYTSDASLMTITFTDAITAASTLASGQTVTIIYAEP